MPDDRDVRHSLAYRKNVDAILRGEVPEKYTRLLPHIPGDKVLELGSAEGVLALLLAKQGKQVTALERSPDRHAAAQLLRDAWGMDVNGPRFINGDAGKNLTLLKGHDTLVAIRMIYYLGVDLDRVFAEAAKHISNVVLCGNKNRAKGWREGVPPRNDKADNYYASHEGMIDLLERHGYEIRTVIEEGDPIVVGAR